MAQSIVLSICYFLLLMLYLNVYPVAVGTARYQRDFNSTFEKIFCGKICPDRSICDPGLGECVNCQRYCHQKVSINCRAKCTDYEHPHILSNQGFQSTPSKRLIHTPTEMTTLEITESFVLIDYVLLILIVIILYTLCLSISYACIKANVHQCCRNFYKSLKSYSRDGHTAKTIGHGSKTQKPTFFKIRQSRGKNARSPGIEDLKQQAFEEKTIVTDSEDLHDVNFEIDDPLYTQSTCTESMNNLYTEDSFLTQTSAESGYDPSRVHVQVNVHDCNTFVGKRNAPLVRNNTFSSVKSILSACVMLSVGTGMLSDKSMPCTLAQPSVGSTSQHTRSEEYCSSCLAPPIYGLQNDMSFDINLETETELKQPFRQLRNTSIHEPTDINSSQDVPLMHNNDQKTHNDNDYRQCISINDVIPDIATERSIPEDFHDESTFIPTGTNNSDNELFGKGFSKPALISKTASDSTNKNCAKRRIPFYEEAFHDHSRSEGAPYLLKIKDKITSLPYSEADVCVDGISTDGCDYEYHSSNIDVHASSHQVIRQDICENNVNQENYMQDNNSFHINLSLHDVRVDNPVICQPSDAAAINVNENENDIIEQPENARDELRGYNNENIAAVVDNVNDSMHVSYIPRSITDDSAVASIYDPNFMNRDGFHLAHIDNNPLYEHLQGMSWVMGYHSEGRSISVYADLDIYDVNELQQQLVDATGQPLNKFKLRPNVQI